MGVVGVGRSSDRAGGRRPAGVRDHVAHGGGDALQCLGEFVVGDRERRQELEHLAVGTGCSDDPLSVEPSRLREISSELTLLDGEVTWAQPGFEGTTQG